MHGFTLTGCDNKAKVMLTIRATMLDKKGPFNNIPDWNSFKIKLIEEFGNIDIFSRDINQIFDLIP